MNNQIYKTDRCFSVVLVVGRSFHPIYVVPPNSTIFEDMIALIKAALYTNPIPIYIIQSIQPQKILLHKNA